MKDGLCEDATLYSKIDPNKARRMFDFGEDIPASISSKIQNQEGDTPYDL